MIHFISLIFQVCYQNNFGTLVAVNIKYSSRNNHGFLILKLRLQSLHKENGELQDRCSSLETQVRFLYEDFVYSNSRPFFMNTRVWDDYQLSTLMLTRTLVIIYIRCLSVVILIRLIMDIWVQKIKLSFLSNLDYCYLSLF